MHVRRTGVAGVAELGDDLAFLDLVARLDQQRPHLQVRVEAVLALADVLDDEVAVHVADGELSCQRGVRRREYPGRVGLEFVERRGDRSVGNGDDLGAVVDVALVFRLVTLVEGAGLVQSASSRSRIADC